MVSMFIKRFLGCLRQHRNRASPIVQPDTIGVGWCVHPHNPIPANQ